MFFSILKNLMKPKDNLGSWIETAIRLGIVYLSGGAGSTYQMVDFVRSGAGLPSTGEDIDYFAKKIAQETGASEEEVKKAVVETEEQEQRHLEQEFSPNRWVISEEGQSYQEQAVLSPPKTILSGTTTSKVKAGIAVILVGGAVYWLIRAAEKDIERYQ